MFSKLKQKIVDWNHQRLKSRQIHIARKLDIIENKLSILAQAVADQNGLSFAKMRMSLLNVPQQYEYILCAVPQGSLVIDGGANLGLFSDLMLGLGAEVHAFEPNPILYSHLKRKYEIESEEKLPIKLYQKAISNEAKEQTFSMSKSGAFIAATQGGSLAVDPGADRIDFHVESINFADYIQDLKNRNIRPYIIKLDIEGSEFEVLDSLIDKNLCGAFDYLLCETHERFFPDGEEKMRHLKDKLQKNGIQNVFLDWA